VPTRPTRSDLEALASRDERLSAWLGRVAPYPGFPDRKNVRQRSHWDSLASAIVYQQLHGKAAATIHGRIRALTPGSGFPTPADILGLSDAALREAGLSRQKLAALRDLAARIEDGRLPLAGIARASDEAIVEILTEVRGIGPWSARMFLLFRLGRLDVMAETDFGVLEGMRILDGRRKRPTPRQALARAEVWRPLRSVGCWTMWRIVEHERARARAEGAGVGARLPSD
jgi:3-methyladenine DNA glycosylase/8-oxoguanine DNA glycosylase